MPFGDGVGATISVQDSSGDVGSFTISFPSNADIPMLIGTFIPAACEAVDQIIDGQIVGAAASINVNLNGVDIKDAPIVGSDVEEGAVFSFRSNAGAPTKFRLPSFDETFGLETGVGVDTAADPVDDLIQRVIVGDQQGLTLVQFADSHGNDIVAFQKALESFRKTKR